jgi:hypothetical protein
MPNNPADFSPSPLVKISHLARLFIALLIVVYLVDAVWFYVRRSDSEIGQASGSVHRKRLLAISDKGGKTEYTIDAVEPEEDIPCALSLFSHAGQKPCWYVTRHAADPIPM